MSIGKGLAIAVGFVCATVLALTPSTHVIAWFVGFGALFVARVR